MPWTRAERGECRALTGKDASVMIGARSASGRAQCVRARACSAASPGSMSTAWCVLVVAAAPARLLACRRAASASSTSSSSASASAPNGTPASSAARHACGRPDCSLKRPSLKRTTLLRANCTSTESKAATPADSSLWPQLGGSPSRGSACEGDCIGGCDGGCGGGCGGAFESESQGPPSVTATTLVSDELAVVASAATAGSE
eukprot:702134-Pleurochrysis_carterae.AAC.2